MRVSTTTRSLGLSKAPSHGARAKSIIIWLWTCLLREIGGQWTSMLSRSQEKRGRTFPPGCPREGLARGPATEVPPRWPPERAMHERLTHMKTVSLFEVVGWVA